MSYSETITRESLTNILNEVLPISYSLSSVKTVTLPFTPTSNGLLIGLIRTTAQGRAYVSLNNTTPNLMDGFNVTEGYCCATVFAEKGKQISVASTYNVKQHLYYFVSLGNDSLTDYIVEQGTSGNWTYRKWNSGIAECWYYMTGTTDSSGRWHYNPSLPTFLTSTQIIVNATGWSQGYVTTHAGYTKANYVSNQWSIDGYLENGASSKSCAVSLSVIGKWK